MTFNEIQKITGAFTLPHWPPGKYIKVNYNQKRKKTHIQAVPKGFHIEIINDNSGEMCAIEFDSINGWTLTEEDMHSFEWRKL